MQVSPALLPTALLALLAVTPAQAQPRTPAAAPSPPAQATPAGAMPAIAFKCPVNGLAIESRTEHQINEFVSQGPDPSDPTICRWKRGFTVTESYFGLVTRATTDGLAELRAGLQALLNGQQTEFSVRKSGIAVGGGRNEYQETWRRLPNETLTVAGRTVNTFVLQNDQRGVQRTSLAHRNCGTIRRPAYG